MLTRVARDTATCRHWVIADRAANEVIMWSEPKSASFLRASAFDYSRRKLTLLKLYKEESLAQTNV